ncbi:hypothetical protein [Tepidiforma sp.]|uniref:hypothetical protein n=1 Tax=Tepidiforma sp. TaxID=2682230 RepID=UPI002ADD8BB4|nr:hypothetical protein [Tepidiforma sp.]
MQPARRLPRAALAIGATLVILLGSTYRPARALAENDLTFTLAQNPPAGTTVQVGSTVQFVLSVTVNASIGSAPLLFDFDYPNGLAYTGQQGGGGVVSCTDNSPSAGVLRCNFGPVAPGALEPLTLTFTITSDATTDPDQALLRAGPSVPDSAADGDDSFTGAGTLTVFAEAMFQITSPSPPVDLFEGASRSYTVTIQNNSSSSTGEFDATVYLPGGKLLSVQCTAAQVSLTDTSATCRQPTIPPAGQTSITVQLRPPDTPTGDDITPTLSAPSLGIVGRPLTTITVHELGLQRISGAPAVGSPITVCTADLPNDQPSTTAAGKPQPNDPTRLVGTSSGSALLQTQDFTVNGPSGTLTPASATGCGPNQSGVTFSPAEPGTYTVTARYNTGGTNVLAIEVPGSTNPLPVLSTISPSTAAAGSGTLTLTLTGSGFIATSEARWNGTPLTTTYLTPTQLTALLPASLLTSPGTANITVVNPSPGGGTSASRTFTIAPSATKLTFTTQPGNGTAGQPLAVQPVVAVQTADGTTVTSDNTTIVTLAISDGGTLTCTGGLVKTVVAGVATFSGCTVTPARAGYHLTATSTPPLTAATSAPFDVLAAPPTETTQLAFPAPSGPVPRSRLTFAVQTGNLSPTQVRLVIRRPSDGKYWNTATSTWQADPVQNLMTSSGNGQWQLAITGAARRSFANTAVAIQAYATANGTEYRSAATAGILVR